MSESPAQFTSVSVHTEVKSRLEELKPYDSMSWSEFAEELADVYEKQAT